MVWLTLRRSIIIIILLAIVFLIFNKKLDKFLDTGEDKATLTGEVVEEVEQPEVKEEKENTPIKDLFQPKDEGPEMEEETETSEIIDIKTINRTINFRSYPKVNYNWIGLIYSGSEVSVYDISSDDKWYQVEYNGTKWWISYLAFIPKPTKKKEETTYVPSEPTYVPQEPEYEYQPPVVDDNLQYYTYCGDGMVQMPNHDGQYEQCDDGNKYDGDTCSSVCLDNEFDRDDDSLKEELEDMACNEPIVQLVCNLWSHYCPSDCRKDYIDYEVLDF